MTSGNAVGGEQASNRAKDSPENLLSQNGSLLDLVFDAVIEWDFDTDTTRSWNRGAEHLYGWSREEAIGRSPHDLLQTVFPVPLGEIKRLLPVEGRWEGELIHSTREGYQIVVSTRWAFHYVEGGAAHVLEVTTDITDRRRAETERAQLAAIVRSSSDAILGKTIDGTITSWNRAAERLYQYTAEEVIGQSVGLLIPPERGNELEHIMQKVRRGEAIEHKDTVRVRKDGQRIDVSVSISPIRNRAGSIIGAATIARDISAQKREEAERLRLLEAEREARTQAEWAERRLAFLAEASAVLSSSLDYEATLANVARLAVPHVADWCGIDILDDEGVPRRLAVTHVDPEKVELALSVQERYPPDPDGSSGTYGVLRTGEPLLVREVTDEMIVRAARDEEHLALLRSLGLSSVMTVPLRARDHIFGVISFGMAESGKRYDEEDLALAEDLARRAGLAVDNARLYRNAQEALRLREEFLSIASHELKTPLTALQLQAQLLRRLTQDTASQPEGQRVLNGMERQVKRLTRLTNDLLDVSRIASSRFTLDRSEVDLEGVVEDVVSRFTEEIAAAGSSVIVHAASSVTGDWDRDRVDQVVSNLLSNAIKYGRGGRIEIDVSAVGDTARVVVVDDGIGIAPEHLSQIFDRFERVETPERSGGLGLGLFIVREIVSAHSGRVWAESSPEAGARFIVELPRTWKGRDEPGN